jgi:decaprenyl-phosphate phosphoribosyltransferase
VPSLATNLIKLARPAQWAKGVFVLVGPLYALADPAKHTHIPWLNVACAFVAFGLASSGCYIINDLRDRDADRLHPRKSKRPIASGSVTPAAALWFAFILFLLATAAALAPVWASTLQFINPAGAETALRSCLWTVLLVAAYIFNTIAYSIRIKHLVILDVLSLSLGFVLRVLGGCAAAGVEPSSWLLNCTFFVSMFLALGKRLGELRSLGDSAASVRGVLGTYTIDFLRMAVVVTAVACLVTYSGYVQSRSDQGTFHYAGWGFNLLWLTMLPATYALLRTIVQMERGKYDDPTELAYKDNAFRVAVLLFALLTAIVIFTNRYGA